MKIRVTGETAKAVKARLEAASEYFDTPMGRCTWTRNKLDPVTGELMHPQYPEGERVAFQPGLAEVRGRTIYRNCYGETLAVIEEDAILLTGRRHQSLYGAPELSRHRDANPGEIEVLETSRPDLPWYATAS